MTPEEKSYLESVTQGANSLASLFLAISQEVPHLPRVQELTRRGGLAALAMGGNAAARINDVEMQPTGYDLADLAVAPPPSVEE